MRRRVDGSTGRNLSAFHFVDLFIAPALPTTEFHCTYARYDILLSHFAFIALQTGHTESSVNGVS